MDNDAERRAERRRAILALLSVGAGFLAGAAFGFVSGWQKGGLVVGAAVAAAAALAGAFIAAALVGFGAVRQSLAVLLRSRGSDA